MTVPPRTSSDSAVGSGTTPEAVVSYPEPNIIRVNTGSSQRARWADDSNEGFGSADDGVGFTAEIRMRVTRSTSTDRGVDFELYIGDGTLPGKRYFLSITTTGLYWRGGATVEQIATGLDNYSQMHTYRLAVRPDGIVQIYRDLFLFAVKKADFGIDPLINTEGSYMQFGDGSSSSETDFEIKHIAIDIGGSFDPQSCIVDFKDLTYFVQDWLENDIHSNANLNKTGSVDFKDYSILADDWYQQCPNKWPAQWDD